MIAGTGQVCLPANVEISEDCPVSILSYLYPAPSDLPTSHPPSPRHLALPPYITNGQWQAVQMPKLAPYIIRWSSDQQLLFFNNNENKIYKQVENVLFFNLKAINTWRNGIESVEGLCRVFWPCLEDICLWDNRISCVRALRRLHAPNLKAIDLRNNPILDHKSLSELYIHMKDNRKKLQKFQISIFSNIGALLKMEAEYIGQLFIFYPDQFKSQKMEDAGVGRFVR